MRRKVTAAFAGVVVIVAVALAGTLGVIPLWAANPHYTPALTLAGEKIAPDFTLADQYGHTFHLADASNKVVLIYFGYTNCPDACPEAMAKYAALAKGLGSDISKVALLFITTDPPRDTAPAIKAWLANYSPAIIGLTGSYKELAKVWQEYGVVVEREGSGPNYGVTHSSLILVADKNHTLKFAFTPDMSAKEYIEGVRSLL